MSNVKTLAAKARESMQEAMGRIPANATTYERIKLMNCFMDTEKLLDAVEKPAKIIRTVEELEELDLDTLLIDEGAWVRDQWSWFGEHERGNEGIFPLAIIATAAQVRKAHKTLEKENDDFKNS